MNKLCLRKKPQVFSINPFVCFLNHSFNDQTSFKASYVQGLLGSLMCHKNQGFKKLINRFGCFTTGLVGRMIKQPGLISSDLHLGNIM